ncbi:MAG: hypothetical protein GX153_05900 [Clostridiaceae bacterium]|nr:hypothetical protein [Clostridiaceae bacterium]
MDTLRSICEAEGPRTGKELHTKTHMDLFQLWKACFTCDDLVSKEAGCRYLRFDKQVAGYARLSPSIGRAFYSYTVFGTSEQLDAVRNRADKIAREAAEVSRSKAKLAREVISAVVSRHHAASNVSEHACFLLSGDIAYGMAHREPRPEPSTDKLVNGSDLDIVVVHDGLSSDEILSLDRLIYDQKNRLLRDPALREEIDYVIKDLARAKEQLGFADFESMVASKVLHEGLFLYGSTTLYEQVKAEVSRTGIPERLDVLRQRAAAERKDARRDLLASDGAIHDESIMQLFYTTDEREEFF